jgi:Xaa-Pro dipeptidase
MSAALTEHVISTPATAAQASSVIAEVARRHDLLAEYLALKGYEALLLQRPANIAWLTCGAEVTRPGGHEPMAAVFLMRDARCLLTNNIDSPYLFDGPFHRLGFQLKERPWHEPREKLISDICRGRRFACDVPGTCGEVVEFDLAQFRARLGTIEESALRDLGRDLARAVEATCRTSEAGVTESELTGQLQHRLARHQIVPVQMQIIADGRGERYRHGGFSDAPISRGATVSVVGRRHGLHLGVSRSFTFEMPDEAAARRYQHSALLLATAMYFSQAGWTAGDVWNRVRRIYEKFGAADEWRLAEQGEILGYEFRERAIVPDCDIKLATGQPLYWHPGVGGVSLGDSLLVGETGQSCLTPPGKWPLMTVQVKGTTITLPALLQLGAASEWAIE